MLADDHSNPQCFQYRHLDFQLEFDLHEMCFDPKIVNHISLVNLKIHGDRRSPGLNYYCKSSPLLNILISNHCTS